MNNTATPALVFRVAWRNVRRNWRHSLAALLTMSVGFISLALFHGYVVELMDSQLRLIYARNMIGEVMVRRPRAGLHDARINPHKYRIEEKEQAFLEAWIGRHAAEVKTRVRTVMAHGMASSGGSVASFIAFGHDVPEGRVARRHWAWNTWAGRPIRDDEKSGAVLTMGLATILGCDVDADDARVMDPATGTPRPEERPFKCRQPQVSLTAASGQGRMNALDADIVGITHANIRELDQKMMLVPLAFAQELAGTTGVANYQVILNDPSRGPALRAELAEEVKRAGLDLEVMDWRDSEVAEPFRRGMDILAVYRTLMVMVILAIAGAAVLTTMTKTVRERTREVGTLRSIGYRAPHILGMFGLEAAMLSVMASLVGLAGAVAITAGINSAGITYKAGLLAESIPLVVGYAPSTYGWGFLFLALVAVSAALLAARHVTRMKIAAALQES